MIHLLLIINWDCHYTSGLNPFPQVVWPISISEIKYYTLRLTKNAWTIHSDIHKCKIELGVIRWGLSKSMAWKDTTMTQFRRIDNMKHNFSPYLIVIPKPTMSKLIELVRQLETHLEVPAKMRVYILFRWLSDIHQPKQHIITKPPKSKAKTH